MLRNFLLALLGAPLLVLLAGCCGNTACDCQDLLADSLYFSFTTTGPNGFSLNEISTVYLARYDSTALTVSRDSLPLPRNTRTAKALRTQIAKLPTSSGIPTDTTGLLIISNNAPFTVATSTSNLSRYVYRLYVPQDSAGTVRKHTFTTFTFDRIRLKGRYQADGCCTCYLNLQKLARVRGGSAYPGTGSTFNLTESGSGSTRLPSVIPLSK